MKISEILKKECIRIPLQATDKTGAITELVDLLHAHEHFTERDDVLAAIIARENTRSTGIGQGLAVPHGKTRGCRQLTMAVGKPASLIDFGSPDGFPCGFIVLLASPIDKTGPHIQALAAISRLMINEQFRLKLEGADCAGDVYKLLSSPESE